MSLKVLYIAEIVGKPGISCVKNRLPRLIEERQPDFVVANGEGATQGFGLGRNHAAHMRKMGIDLFTGGEKIYYKKDMAENISNTSYVLRPANFSPGSPGRGWRILEKNGKKLAVVSLLGQSGFNRVHPSNPFTYLPEIIKRLNIETRAVILDFHASTTAEKYTMFYQAAGKVSAVIGSHTKAQSADEQIIDNHTAVICDAGMTGSCQSVGGFEPKTEIKQFISQIPDRSQENWLDLQVQGVDLEIDDNGRALSIERLRIVCEREK